jgi:sporulation protein YlmC with PRC-barrel domain
MRNLLTMAVLGTALIATPALAADNSNATTASSTGQWQASKLIHMNVYNNNNEKIGDIKELMTDNSGKIENVVIGVGGFLGMGEHDVAVKFSELKFVNEPAKSSTTSSTTTTRPATTTTGANTTTTTTRSDNSNKTYPDHAVLNASKDQLKSMPEFKYNK